MTVRTIEKTIRLVNYAPTSNNGAICIVFSKHFSRRARIDGRDVKVRSKVSGVTSLDDGVEDYGRRPEEPPKAVSSYSVHTILQGNVKSSIAAIA